MKYNFEYYWILRVRFTRKLERYLWTEQCTVYTVLVMALQSEHFPYLLIRNVWRIRWREIRHLLASLLSNMAAVRRRRLLVFIWFYLQWCTALVGLSPSSWISLMRTHHLVVHLRSQSLTSIGRRRRRRAANADITLRELILAIRVQYPL